MKVFLMHPDRDFEVKPELRDEIFEAMLNPNLFALTHARRSQQRDQQAASVPPPEPDATMVQDLELGTLWNAMAGGDDFLRETARRAVLSSLRDPDEIRYRQGVLADCLQQAAVIRELYELAIEALDNERKAGGGHWRTDRPHMTLYRSVQELKLQVDVLWRLRRLADEHARDFRSAGFTRLFETLGQELTEGYLRTAAGHLRQLEFNHGVLASAELGKGDRGRQYIVRTPQEVPWTERFRLGNRTSSYSFTIAPRDEAGFQALERIRDRSINLVANAVAQAADHIKSFFLMLRLELAFYLGCVNLHELLAAKGEPVCFPEPAAAGELALTARELYDVCLSLHVGDRVVGNDVDADGKALVLVTGANQGGKSTLLRSLGVAQLMLQSGMFVGAQSLRASISTGIFTHYKRQEDASMEGGKLDEELGRMSQIAGLITPGSILLCNESFASTNEREGSEIARQVIRAMVDKQIRVVVVTHMYDLAHSLREEQLDIALFLRAERQPDGRRTFRILPGEPLPTSYGEDSYRRIFGPATAAAAAGRIRH
jgi:DNA mismatch repair ATPase MutS